MLTSVSRTAARRVLSAAVASKLPHSSARIAPLRRLAPIARSFTVSAWIRSPAASGTQTKKKAVTKKPTKKKAKKAAPKKKKTKKTLTPEEKEKAEIRDLRKKALLKGPSLLPETAWSVFVSENVPTGHGSLADKVKAISADFKGISDIEKSRLSNIGHSNKEANKDTRREWVESYPAEAIYVANIARRRLARKLQKNRVYLIHDDRLPKRAGTAYTLFIQSRFSQVDQGSAKDTFRAVSEEWKNLSESDKAPFTQKAAQQAAQSKEQLKSLREKGKAYWKDQEAKSKASKTKP